VTPIKWGRSLV